MSAFPRHCFSRLTSKRALTLWMTPIIQWDRSWESLGSEPSSDLPALLLLQWCRQMEPLCSAHSMTVLLSASNFHPALEGQCWGTTEMAIRFAPRLPPTPLACCTCLCSEAGQVASLSTAFLPTALRVCDGWSHNSRTVLFSRTRDAGQGA